MEAITSDTSSTLQKLLREAVPVGTRAIDEAANEVFDADSAGAVGDNPATAIATGKLVDSLALLERGESKSLPAGDVQTKSGGSYHNLFFAFRPLDSDAILNPADKSGLDIASSLFDRVFSDSALPETTKIIIGWLQYPVLKIALFDSLALHDKTNPAVRLVTLTVAASKRCNSERAVETLHELIGPLFRRIAHSFNGALSVFENAIEILTTHLERDRATAKPSGLEDTRLEQLKQRVGRSKVAVEQALRACIDGKEIRPFVRLFLVEHWQRLLIVAHVQHGPQSDIWAEYIQTADELIWSTQTKTSDQERASLTVAIPRLLKNLREGMATLELDAAIRQAFLDKLTATHVDSLQHQNDETPMEMPEKREDIRPEPGLPPQYTGDTEFIKQGLARLFEQPLHGPK